MRIELATARVRFTTTPLLGNANAFQCTTGANSYVKGEHISRFLFVTTVEILESLSQG